MAEDDHSRQPQRRQWWHDSRGTRGGGGRGGSCSNTTTGAPHGSDGYTSWPLYLDPWTGTVQMWPSFGGGGGQRPAASPVGDAGRCSPVRSSSAAGRPDLCVAPGASTSDDVDTMDGLQCSLLRSSSAAGRPDLHAAPDASTTGIVATVDELLEPAAAIPLLPHHDDGSS
jgi:hypothetical protein